LACILALDGFFMEGRNIRASYGTSKYCSAFIKNVRCNNPECTYLHQMGDVEDTFTKQEIQAGYVTSGRDVLARQQQIVAQALSASSLAAGGVPPRRKAGGGGPSGTGRSSTSSVFPAPTYDEPPKPPPTLTPPPPNAITSRAITTGAGFPTIAAANATTQASVPSTIVRSSSAGRLVAAINSAESLGPTPKGSIGIVIPPARKTSVGAPTISTSSSGPMTMPPTGATAASVVAGAHSTSRSSEPPAPHTTLTPLTPLKRTTNAKSATKSSGTIGGDQSTDPSMQFPKGLTSAERTAFLELRKETMATMARQQTENATKLTSLRSGMGKKANGTKAGGSSPDSPSPEGFGAGGTLPIKNLPSSKQDTGISLIGGAVIAAPGTPGPGSIRGAVVSIERGILGEAPGARNFLEPAKDGLGGLGGEVFNGPLKSSGLTSAIGSGAAIGSGSAIGSGIDKWNSNPIGGDPVFNPSGLWANGRNSNGVPSHGLGAAPGTNPSGGGIIGGPGSLGSSSGSSALASMLGINLPTGSGSLRENSNLWGTSPSPSQPPIAALNGSSFPLQGVIGPSSVNTGGLIGGVTIGGGHPPMGVGAFGNGGNKNDIALLQSLLPGVHITSSTNHQQQGGGFGAIGGGWGNTPVPNQQIHQRPGGSGLRVGETHQGGHWIGGLQSGGPVGAIGQSGSQQNQRQAPGSIW
jgi:hypothetical protein